MTILTDVLFPGRKATDHIPRLTNRKKLPGIQKVRQTEEETPRILINRDNEAYGREARMAKSKAERKKEYIRIGALIIAGVMALSLIFGIIFSR